MKNQDEIYLSKLFDLFTNKDKNITIMNLFKERKNHLPSLLYNYCSIGSTDDDNRYYAIETLNEEKLFFQYPSNYNDPFDGSIAYNPMELFFNALNVFFTSIKQNQHIDTIKNMARICISLYRGEHKYKDDYMKIYYQTKSNNLMFILQGIEKNEKELVYTLSESEAFYKYLPELLNGSINDFQLADIRKMLLYDEKLKEHCFLLYRNFYKHTVEFKDYYSDFIESVINNLIARKELIKNDDNLIVPLPLAELAYYISLSINNGLKIDFINIRETLTNMYNELTKKFRNSCKDKFKLKCFSEKKDSLLMWSHYSKNHKGFCVEYDLDLINENTKEELILPVCLLFPITYSKKRVFMPNNLHKVFLNYKKNNNVTKDYFIKYINSFLYKSSVWDYEKEWRMFASLADKENKIYFPFIKSVYLGACIDDEAKNKLMIIAEKHNWNVYQMYMLPDKYELAYYKVI